MKTFVVLGTIALGALAGFGLIKWLKSEFVEEVYLSGYRMVRIARAKYKVNGKEAQGWGLTLLQRKGSNSTEWERLSDWLMESPMTGWRRKELRAELKKGGIPEGDLLDEALTRVGTKIIAMENPNRWARIPATRP